MKLSSLFVRFFQMYPQGVMPLASFTQGQSRGCLVPVGEHSEQAGPQHLLDGFCNYPKK
jgi:hypothetical protein